MYDADVATTLLNRWEQSEIGRQELSAALDVLREGGMRFRRVKHRSQEDRIDADHHWEIECLAFEDGSTALRLLSLNSSGDLTPWAAVAPLRRI